MEAKLGENASIGQGLLVGELDPSRVELILFRLRSVCPDRLENASHPFFS
jgi:hypothetical protein